MPRVPHVLLAFCLAATASAQEKAPATKIGSPVPPFELEDIRYLPRKLDELGEKRAFVLVFVTRECPIAKRYLPEVKRLSAAYAERGVQFVVVDVGAGDDIVAMASNALAHDLPMPVLKDMDGQAVRAVGVTRTPEVAVLDGEHVLRYRGRIDDQVRFGGARPKPTRRDLREALEELLAGKPVSVPETPVDGCRITVPKPAPDKGLTFTRDIALLAQRHCQDCHRRGGSAPFPLVTYEQLRRHGEMIAEVVAQRRMPPWFASGGAEAFTNHRGMSAPERQKIIDWVQAGMRRGDPAHLPPPREFPKTKWAIGEPDLVLRMRRPIKVMADGYMPYQYVMLSHRFEEDTWVQKIEINGEHPEVLHHCNLFFLRPGKRFESSQILAGKVPGGAPLDLDDGVAVLIPKGAMLGLQIHYQPSGIAVEDLVSVALRYPKAPIKKRFRSAVIEDRSFEIPPHAPHHRVEAAFTFDEDVVAGGLFGHMHLRGKDVTFSVTVPGKPAETLLEVPNYSFDWQMGYEFATPRRFPKGTRIDCVAHFDNSRFNPFNPDPSKAVRYGLQTVHEMMYCFVFYVREDEDLNIRVDPRTGVALR